MEYKYYFYSQQHYEYILGMRSDMIGGRPTLTTINDKSYTLMSDREDGYKYLENFTD